MKDFNDWELVKAHLLQSLKADRMAAFDIEHHKEEDGSHTPSYLGIGTMTGQAAIFPLRTWHEPGFLPTELRTALEKTVLVGSGILKDAKDLPDVPCAGYVDTQKEFDRLKEEEPWIRADFGGKKGLGPIAQFLYGFDFKSNNHLDWTKHDAVPTLHPHPRDINPGSDFQSRTTQKLYTRDLNWLTKLQARYDSLDLKVSAGFMNWLTERFLNRNRAWATRAREGKMDLGELYAEAVPAYRPRELDDDQLSLVGISVRYHNLGKTSSRRAELLSIAPDAPKIVVETVSGSTVEERKKRKVPTADKESYVFSNVEWFIKEGAYYPGDKTMWSTVKASWKSDNRVGGDSKHATSSSSGSSQAGGTGLRALSGRPAGQQPQGGPAQPGAQPGAGVGAGSLPGESKRYARKRRYQEAQKSIIEELESQVQRLKRELAEAKGESQAKKKKD